MKQGYGYLSQNDCIAKCDMKVGLPYALFLEDMSSISMKNNLSSEDIKKCSNVLLFGILNSENMLDFYLLEKHEDFGKF